METATGVSHEKAHVCTVPPARVGAVEILNAGARSSRRQVSNPAFVARSSRLHYLTYDYQCYVIL